MKKHICSMTKMSVPGSKDDYSDTLWFDYCLVGHHSTPSEALKGGRRIDRVK